MLLGTFITKKKTPYREYDRDMRKQLLHHEWFYNVLYPSMPAPLRELTTYADDVSIWAKRINHMNVHWASQTEPDYYLGIYGIYQKYPLPISYHLGFSLYYQKTTDFTPLLNIDGIGRRYHATIRRAFTDCVEARELFTDAIRDHPHELYKKIKAAPYCRQPMSHTAFRSLREWWLENIA